MAYFNIKERRYIPQPIPPVPPYVPPTPPTPPSPESGSTPILPVPGHTASTFITLYKTYSEINALNKKLFYPVKYSIAFKDDVSAVNPVIVLEVNGNLSGYNFAYIDYTERYYHIIDKQLVQGDIWRLVLKTDVLMSFRSEINNMSGILARTQDGKSVNKDYPDNPEYLANEQIVVLKYDDVAEHSILEDQHAQWVLVTVGKDVTASTTPEDYGGND